MENTSGQAKLEFFYKYFYYVLITGEKLKTEHSNHEHFPGICIKHQFNYSDGNPQSSSSNHGNMV